MANELIDDVGAAAVAAEQLTVPGETPAEGQVAPSAQSPEDATGDVEVTIGDVTPTDEHREAPTWVKELRKSHRELARRNRELEYQLKAAVVPAAKPALGVKPTLEGCDYDTERYDTELTGWHERRQAVEAEARQVEKEAQAQQVAWQNKVGAYTTAKSALRVQGYDEAEALVQDTLSQVQQGIILQGAENPALLVYALGRNPAKARELANITDPVQYAFAVAKLETQLKVNPKRAAPPPEREVQTGTAPTSGTVDSQLEKLRADAALSGDYSKVFAYKRAKRKP